jgi:ABC-2 type transport system permease protein
VNRDVPNVAPPNRNPAPQRFPFAILVRYRAVQLRNTLDQQLRDAPVRAFAILVMMLIIWAALYNVLMVVMRQLGRWELVAVVANQHVFIHFFLVLAVMLAFSNAILAFGSLFGRSEAGHLMAMPVPTRQVVCLKWLEGLLLSSWSFLLLGLPLMLAMSRTTDVAWYYYPLFVGHFLAFVIIPSTLGLLVAWVVAMWAPHRPLAIAIWGGVIILAAGSLYGWSLMRGAQAPDIWLQKLYGELSLAKQPFLPSTWSAKGIVAAMHHRAGESALYLAAVISNGAFLVWLTTNILGHTWAEAYNRAHQGRGRSLIRNAWVTAAIGWALFFYLPRRLRLLMFKDLRGLVRDATQWTQMVIMLGLLAIYALNLKRLPVDLEQPAMRALLAFLNLLAVSLILDLHEPIHFSTRVAGNAAIVVA